MAGHRATGAERLPCSFHPRSNPREDTDEGEEKTLVGLRAIPVLAYRDTQAENGEALDYSPRELPPLMEVAQRLGVKMAYAPTKAGNLGSCKTDGSCITLGSDQPGPCSLL